MADLRQGPDGELVSVQGSPELVTGNEAIAQRVRLRIKLAQGEWYRDTLRGVPWREILGAKGTALSARTEGILAAEAQRDPDVVSATASVTLDGASRELSATVNCVLRGGDTITIEI